MIAPILIPPIHISGNTNFQMRVDSDEISRIMLDVTTH